MAGRAPFEEIPHTADVALRIRGSDWVELLTNAARGMFHLIDARPKTDERRVREVELSAGDRESLLVEWLSELLSLHDTHGEGYDEFEIEEAESNRLRARIRGGPVGSGARLQIKAVTYHDLEIRDTDQGYEARVTFDV